MLLRPRPTTTHLSTPNHGLILQPTIHLISRPPQARQLTPHSLPGRHTHLTVSVCMLWPREPVARRQTREHTSTSSTCLSAFPMISSVRLLTQAFSSDRARHTNRELYYVSCRGRAQLAARTKHARATTHRASPAWSHQRAEPAPSGSRTPGPQGARTSPGRATTAPFSEAPKRGSKTTIPHTHTHSHTCVSTSSFSCSALSFCRRLTAPFNSAICGRNVGTCRGWTRAGVVISTGHLGQDSKDQ
jgi:hypothetical protein